MDIKAILRNTKVLAAIIIILVLAVAVATAPENDDDGSSSGGGGGDTKTKREYTVEEYDFSGVASGIVGIGMNGEHTFPVDEGAFKVIVNLSGSGVTGAEDLDLTLEGADGGSATSGNPSSEESIILRELDIMKRFGYGDYTATAVAYAALGTPYDMHVEVYYYANGTV